MSISLITVCHKSRQKITAYVSSFLEHHTAAAERAQYQFVFVENSGDTDFQSAVQPLMDAGFAVIVLNTANDGFGRGCNAGAQHATGDILIFANPDIRFLGNLAPVQAHAKQPFWGTVRQITPSGRMYFIDLLPENKGFFFELFKLRHLINLFFNWFLHKSYVVGSFLIVSKDIFVNSDGFNPAFFLYFEETELARRLQTLSGPPMIETQAAVFHEGFGSHSSWDEIFRHEANGFLTYCEITKQPRLLPARLRTLKLMGMVSKSYRKRFHVLKAAALNEPI
jgi:GT2 family glycosyltransferase